eukprot:4313301-Pyramimonas_sp.AAC.1
MDTRHVESKSRRITRDLFHGSPYVRCPPKYVPTATHFWPWPVKSKGICETWVALGIAMTTKSP